LSKNSESASISVKKEFICRVIDTFDGSLEPALRWLLEPLLALSGARPIDCLEDSGKLDQLKAVITKLETGEFS
jgi:uncharacterized protein (DUF2384 family)